MNGLLASDPSIGTPVEALIRLIRGRHKPDILIRLGKGRQRFTELRRAIPGVSERVLARQLDELERDGLIERRSYAEVPPRVEYYLTPPRLDAVSTDQADLEVGGAAWHWFPRAEGLPMHFDTKIAVVLREDLLTWQKPNVTALAVTTDAKLSVYTAELFSTPHDEANRAAVKGQRSEELNLVGMAVRGRKKLMDRLLKGLRLHP